MDDQRFDALTRLFASARSRRAVVKALAGVAAGGLLGLADAPGTGAAPRCRSAGQRCQTGADCCPTPNGTLCAANSCTPCPSGTTACDGRCAPTACDGGQSFDPAACRCACPTGTRLCADGCTDTGSDAANCGSCGTPCPPDAICVGGACACPLGRTLCAGACVDTSGDPANCGGCGTACAFAHAGATCQNGTCSMGACGDGYANCDAASTNGCETDLFTDPANCGGCGAACATGQGCVSGTCRCPSGQTPCDGTCADLLVDPLNCGACGTACPVCRDGQCASDTPYCGDGVCNGSETCVTCPGDCGPCTGGTECATDADCVPATCCHPGWCVPLAQAPLCNGVACDAGCQEWTLDCGQGYCACQSGYCQAVAAEG